MLSVDQAVVRCNFWAAALVACVPKQYDTSEWASALIDVYTFSAHQNYPSVKAAQNVPVG